MKSFDSLQSGQSLVELLVAIALLSVILPALIVGMVASREGKAAESEQLQATAYVNEAVDAVRSVREKGWTTNIASLSTTQDYHPQLSGSAWSLVSGIETLGNYQRKVDFFDVQRDSTGNIVSTGGTVDPSTKKVTVTVSWSKPYSSSVNSTFYITRYLENNALGQPSPSPFTTYTTSGSSGVTVGASSVTLGTGGSGGEGKGDWCAATPKIVSALNLNGSADANAVWGIPINSTPPTSEAFVGTGNNSSGDDFINVSITDPQVASPVPVSSQNGTYNHNYKTNDVFGDRVGSQSYAYIATNNNSNHVAILQVSPPTVTQIGSVDLGTPTSASSIFVLGNTGYVTAGSKLYTFDLTSRSGAKTPLANITLAGVANSIFVVNTGTNSYAFVSTGAATSQLQIVDVTNRTSMSIIGSLTVSGGTGKGIYASSDGQRAYLVTAQSATQPEFFIIDTSNKSTPSVLGSYDINSSGSNTMNPRAVNMVLSKSRAIIVGAGGTEQYIVLNISNESTPVKCAGMAVSGSTVYDVVPVLEADNDAYAYIVTSDNSTGALGGEFKIIEGGPGSGLAASGVYESATFDAGNTASFNRIQATFNQPAGTSISFQVAVAPPVSGSCTAAVFSYQNVTNVQTTTSGTTTTLNATIPAITSGNYQNPGRCFRYRATLNASSDLLSAPTLQNVSINYSP